MSSLSEFICEVTFLLSHTLVMLINFPLLIITHADFDGSHPSSIQGACHISTQLSDVALPGLLSMSSHSSVDRAPARCSGSHGFLSGLSPTLVSC